MEANALANAVRSVACSHRLRLELEVRELEVRDTAPERLPPPLPALLALNGHSNHVVLF